MRSSIVLGLAIVAHGAWAQEPGGSQSPPPSVRLTVEEAVAKALATSARLEQRSALERVASADVRAARAARLPRLDLSAGYTRLSDVPELILPLPGAPPRVIFPNIPNNFSTHAGLALPLYTGGRLNALIDANRGERSAAGQDLEADRQDVVLETRTAYWTLVTARQTAEVLGEALEAYDAHLKDAQNRESFGLAARNEVLAVRVERERAELSRLRAENAAAVTEANLARLTGLEAGAAIETVDALEGAQPERPPTEALVASALASRAERQALAARILSAEARIRLERAALLPQVTLATGYDYSRPNRAIVPPEDSWRDSWSVGISAGLSLFDGGKAAAGMAKARAQVEALKAQLADLTQRIRLQVTQRALDLDAARAAVAVAERNLESAKENRQVARDRYREGLIASSELLDAEVALLRAGLDRTQSMTELRLAAAGLERAVGR